MLYSTGWQRAPLWETQGGSALPTKNDPSSQIRGNPVLDPDPVANPLPLAGRDRALLDRFAIAVTFR